MIGEKLVASRRQNIRPCSDSNRNLPKKNKKPLFYSAGVDVLEMANAQLLLTAFPGTKGFESK
jgi:hypothetical protein